MKIVFIIDQVYLHGGIERVLSIKANYLSQLDYNQISIITTEQRNKKPCYTFNNNIIFKDLKINYCRSKSYFHPLNLLKSIKHIFRLKKTIKNINPDVVVVCSHSSDTYFVPFINKSIPKIKEFHYSKSIEENKRNKHGITLKKLFFSFTDYVEKKYDKIIILNPDESKYYKSNNTIVIPNPLTFFPEKVSNLNSKIIISAGRIAPVKGYDKLIDIWANASKKLPEWELHIYGDGNSIYLKQLRDKIGALNLQDTLSLKGSTDNIEAKMLNASIYVMTSHNECFPLVLLEAQACGLPIISFDCPHGPRNIINKDNGLLIPVSDIHLFANKLVELASESKELQIMGENARKNAYNYSVDKIMAMWLNMFKDLVSNKDNF
ncbi:glycosyltransferase family 4 protein [Sabulilitoribacter multivorans]|uniref:Glycosyltransferase family 4 protein n=1 Tax=Flaviramulus multivorans TaxID=1304750 RepID=A0ABS9IJK3_9FLAO|nr:glycosyltransferase family 4 protein [Flaviramulus multivorans]MCF7560775.1 glycosyltransferase family 4 protein [Flaviramulus multivorans]